jgi:hypothetical protein
MKENARLQIGNALDQQKRLDSDARSAKGWICKSICPGRPGDSREELLIVAFAAS